MGKDRKKSEQHRFYAKYAVAAVLTLLVILAAGITARYLRSDKSDPGQATAQDFYFTTDLLGDSYMVDANGSAGAGNTFSFPAVQSGTWYLYGGSEHNIKINVQNFNDENRITTENITYTASVTAKSPENSNGSSNGTGSSGYTASNVSLKKSDGTEYTGGNLTLSGSQPVTDELTLEIPSYADNSYADETVVTVSLESTEPYVKQIELNFVLYSVDTALRYEVNDSSGSPYAELVIMTNVISSQINGQTTSDVQPYLQWSDDLSIDNANSLTYTYNANATDEALFTQMTGMTSRNMKISRKLNPGESESIYFFKSNTSDNYSLNARAVTPNNDGNYIITIGNYIAS